jgi:hypothetical protein
MIDLLEKEEAISSSKLSTREKLYENANSEISS